MKNITQINLTKASIALALVMALTGYSSMSRAAEIELLDRGVYPYLGFGGGAALLSGVATPSYTTDEDLRPLALGAATQAYYSVALGFVWKRRTSPGWQSMFQFSYRPLAFSAKSSGRTHNYKQNMLSLDFLESYGYFSSWVPYIGLSWNFYNLQFEDTGSDEGATSESTSRLGIVGGWDIMSKPDSHWRIRTNFRWHPEISLNYAGDKVSFPNFEIEPVQVIYRF